MRSIFPVVFLSVLWSSTWLLVAAEGPALQRRGAIVSFISERNITCTAYSNEAFILHVAKGLKLPAPRTLASLGGKALVQLDKWTGQSERFNPKLTHSAQAVELFVVSSKQFADFVKGLQAGGKTSAQNAQFFKKYRVCHFGRFTIIDHARFTSHPSLPAHWSINIAANEALRRYFAEQNSEGEEWLIQGLKAELERVLGPEKTPLITSFSYEDMLDQGPGSRLWHKDMIKLIREKHQSIQPITTVMAYDIVGLSAVEYKQMWSVCRFVLEKLARGKGDRNTFFQLFEQIKAGDSGSRVVTTLMKKDEPKLSNLWASWALRFGG